MCGGIAVGAFLVLAVSAALHGNADSTAPMEKTEQDALYSAIQGFVGKGWNGLELYPDPCGWTPIQGVSCDLFDGLWYVTVVSIGPILDNSLQCNHDAKFNNDLFKLRHMRSLTFFNCFSSISQPTTIPFQGWEKLATSLETLELRSNQGLNGQIPASFGQLIHLKTLVLEENALTGDIPENLGQLVNLKRLALSGNRFTGRIPASVGNNLAQLLILDLSRNSLTGQLPSSLGGLNSLLKLDLSNNLLNGMLPRELGDMKNLTLLDLKYNNLSGGLSQSLQGLISIQDLVLSNNPMGGNLLQIGWGDLRNLTTLDLCNMGLTGEIPESLARVTRLRFLALSNNSLSGSVTPKLAALPSLRALYLNGNNLTGELEFSEEFYKRIGIRFASWDNPNLCYNGVHVPLGLEQCKQGQRVPTNIPGSNNLVITSTFENSNLMATSGVSACPLIVALQEIVLTFLLIFIL